MGRSGVREVLKYIWALILPCLVAAEGWMEKQIASDLSYFQGKTLSRSALQSFYERRGNYLQLVQYAIRDNQVLVDYQHVEAKGNRERIERYEEALQILCDTKGLPDVTLLISINDGLNVREGFPIFAMCKIDSEQILLVPDYEILGKRYQVLKEKDIAEVTVPWEKKIPRLIWRGSTAQKWLKIEEKHLPLLSRLKLCELSELYPALIDAKYTIFAQGGEKIPYLRKFAGNRVSFEEQMQYKYHILIDGNTCPYSNSGWKFFTGSLLFKPLSGWIQWYYGELLPYRHYIPVEENLSDLLAKIEWAMTHDEEAKAIGERCRDFARTHLTFSDDLLYLYLAVIRYSELKFTD